LNRIRNPHWRRSIETHAFHAFHDQMTASSLNKPVSFWANLLRSLNVKARRAAVYALGTFGPRAREALPGLFAAFRDSDAMVREGAVWAVTEIGVRPQDLPSLETLLQDAEPEVRECAINVIGTMIREPSVVQLSIRLLRDADAKLRLRAEDSLRRTDPETIQLAFGSSTNYQMNE